MPWERPRTTCHVCLQSARHSIHPTLAGRPPSGRCMQIPLAVHGGGRAICNVGRWTATGLARKGGRQEKLCNEELLLLLLGSMEEENYDWTHLEKHFLGYRSTNYLFSLVPSSLTKILNSTKENFFDFTTPLNNGSHPYHHQIVLGLVYTHSLHCLTSHSLPTYCKMHSNCFLSILVINH